jgi:hypothetical protein
MAEKQFCEYEDLSHLDHFEEKFIIFLKSIEKN